MADLMTLYDALVEELKDLFDAEQQLVKALPKMAGAAASPDLREALELHVEETQNHVTRLERVFELLDEKAQSKHCAGIAGIIEEGSDALEEDAGAAVMDACIIASAQRAEHYEIAAYGTAVAWAHGLGLEDVAALLSENLEEEKAADDKLTSLAEGGINEAAIEGVDIDEEEEDDEDDDEDDDDEEEEEDDEDEERVLEEDAVGVERVGTGQSGPAESVVGGRRPKTSTRQR